MWEITDVGLLDLFSEARFEKNACARYPAGPGCPGIKQYNLLVSVVSGEENRGHKSCMLQG